MDKHIDNEYNNHQVIATIYNSLLQSRQLFLEASKIDQETGAKPIDFESLLLITKELIMEQSLYNGTIKKEQFNNYIMETRYFNKGHLGILIQNNNTHAFLELLLNLIISHNKATFNMNLENYGVNNLILSIVNSVIETTLGLKDIYLMNNVDIKEFLNDEYINEYVLIGNSNYIETIKMITDKRIVAFPYNDYNVYIDNADYIKFLRNDDYIYSSIDLSYENTKVNSIEEAINLINNSPKKHTSIIYSNNEKDILHFLKKCNSTFVFSNVLPTANVRVGINQEELLNKKTIAYEKINNNK